MVGRDRELARVTGLLDDALAGRGRLVLCTGEAGIGKTRLAEELAAAAAARGVPVAWARAADRGSSPPYGLWRLVLDEPAVRADARARADLWSRLGVAGAADLGADSGVARRFALFAEVRRRLAEAAGRAGCVLVLDDLQWADEASAVLLADVVRQLRGTRILVFATYRDCAGRGLAAAVGGRQHRAGGSAWPARRGGRGHVARRRAGGITGPGRRVHAETGGNPFLVRELARMLAEQRPGWIACRGGWSRRRPTGSPSCRTRPGAAAGRRGGRQQLLGRRGGQDAGPAGAQPARPAGRVPGGRVPGGR